VTKLLYRKALSKKLQIITYLQKKTVTDQKPIPVCITCPSGSERMDFAHALDCAHEVGVLADWWKDWYEARTVLRLENPEVVWRVPEKPISEIIIKRKAYYPVSGGSQGLGITACTWFEYSLSTPLISTAVLT